MYMCKYVCIYVSMSFLDKYTHIIGVTHMLDVSNNFMRLRLILTHLKWGMGPSFHINWNHRQKTIFGHHDPTEIQNIAECCTLVKLNDLCVYKFPIVVKRNRIKLGSETFL